MAAISAGFCSSYSFQDTHLARDLLEGGVTVKAGVWIMDWTVDWTWTGLDCLMFAS